ncbi:hypothetical protein BDZ45DRAFT_691021 [Acephala macrosclerotiorum]|nr:hypothetical protein BDZ45DRAFT_691021 [Acephala macrosclerotiorum]
MSHLSGCLKQISLEDNQAAPAMPFPYFIFRKETHAIAPSQNLIPEYVLSQFVDFYVEMDLRGKVPANMDIKVSLIEADVSVLNKKLTTDTLTVIDAIQHYSQVCHCLQYLFFQRQIKGLSSPEYEHLVFEFVEPNSDYVKERWEKDEEVRKKCGCTRFCSVGEDGQIPKSHEVDLLL